MESMPDSQAKPPPACSESQIISHFQGSFRMDPPSLPGKWGSWHLADNSPQNLSWGALLQCSRGKERSKADFLLWPSLSQIALWTENVCLKTWWVFFSGGTLAMFVCLWASEHLLKSHLCSLSSLAVQKLNFASVSYVMRVQVWTNDLGAKNVCQEKRWKERTLPEAETAPSVSG